MRIAIIGGGASGLITAYLLRNTHQTVVYEADSILGGHVRTLNRNVQDVDLDASMVCENGVLGFDLTAYPTFKTLAERLGLDLQPYVMHSGLFYPGGRCWVTPSPYQKNTDSLLRRLRHFLNLLPLWTTRKKLIASLETYGPDELRGMATSELVPDIDEPCHQALLACFMLAFSMPFDRVGEMPADLTIAYMQGGRLPNWYFIKDGVYSYIATMISKMNSEHQRHCSSPVEYVRRNAEGVVVKARGHQEESFDKVVFATTPGQVLKIIQDPSEAERRRFCEWSCNTFTTLAHRDTGLYRDYPTEVYGPCDYFRVEDKRRFGYNTYVNHGYGQPASTPCSFAYNLEAEIPESAILHRADHQTPDYRVEAFQHRYEVIETNGEHHTFHVGAYLGNGLHEGAASSASAVSSILGGEVLANAAPSR